MLSPVRVCLTPGHYIFWKQKQAEQQRELTSKSVTNTQKKASRLFGSFSFVFDRLLQ